MKKKMKRMFEIKCVDRVKKYRSLFGNVRKGFQCFLS